MSLECDWGVFVYRCYDAHGALLYIGCTRSLTSRMYSHSLKAPWASDVVKVRAEVYPTRREGLRAEREAIEAEAPLYNIVGNRRRRGVA
jgi:excinuclease UvrABC nuclease subunit